MNLKHANQLQTVSKCYRGWRGVANKGTSPRACGWEAYLPLCLNGRSGARHQPLPYWQFLDRTPLHSPPHFGALLGARPVLGALFTRNPSGGCFDCAYSFAQHDIIYEKNFLGVSANEKTATGDKLSLSPLAVDVNVCSCKIRVSKTCAYLCACKHTCAVVCNKCSSHCFSPQSIAKQYKRIL